eukprot:gene1205-1521_t
MYRFKWFIYRTDSKNDHYIYTDHHYENVEKELYSSYADGDVNNDQIQEDSPLRKTFMQMDGSNPNYGYLVYSDQSGPTRNYPGIEKSTIQGRGPTTSGHAKGFIIWNVNTGAGIHVQHSLPDFPIIRNNKINGFNPNSKWIPISPNIENQQFFCYYFPDVTAFSIYMARNDVLVQIIQIPGPTTIPLPPNPIPVGETDIRGDPEITIDFNQYITDKNRKTIINKMYQDCNIKKKHCIRNYNLNIAGLGLTRFYTKTRISELFVDAKSPMKSNNYIRESLVSKPKDRYGYDIWVHVAVTHNRNYLSKTSLKTNSMFSHQEQYEMKVISVLEVYALNFKWMMRTHINELFQTTDKDMQFDSSLYKDHSKVGFLVEPDPYSNDPLDYTFCVGDSNRQPGNHFRGGGVICFESKLLSSYFSRAVAYVIADNKKGKFNKNSFMEFCVYARSMVSIYINNLPAGDQLFEVFDLYTDRNGNDITRFRYPRALFLTDKTGKKEIYVDLIRSVAPDEENDKFPTKGIHSKDILNINYVTSSSEVLFCDSNKQCSDTTQDSVNCHMTVGSITNPIYPPDSFDKEHKENGYFDLGDSSFYVDRSVCHQIGLKEEIQSILEKWRNLGSPNIVIPKPIKISIENVVQSSLKEITPHQDYIIIYAEKDINSPEILSYLITKNIILRSIPNLNSPMSTIMKCIILSISYNIYPIIDNSNLSGFLKIESSDIADITGYDPSKSTTKNDASSIRVFSAYYQIINLGYLPISEFITGFNSFDTNKPWTPLKVFETFEIKTSSNPTPSPVLLLQRLPNNEFKDILINRYGLGSIVVNELTDDQLNSIQLALDKWININGNSTGFQELFTESNNEDPEGLQTISFIDSLTDLETELCQNELTLSNYICDPMSIVDLTDTLLELIQDSIDETGHKIEIGDLIIYFIKKPIQMKHFYPINSGLAVATLNSKLCDIQMVNESDFTSGLIIERMCNQSGPIIKSLSVYSSPSNGGSPVTINGAHFHPNDIVQIGNVNCQSTTFISSTQLLCLTPISTGLKQLVTIIGSEYQDSNHFFNFEKPNIYSLSKLIESKSDQRLVINGTNFGNNINDISIKIGVDSSPKELSVVSVNNTHIECIFRNDTFSEMRLLKLQIKNEYLVVKFQVEWFSTVNPLNLTLYPDDTISVDNLLIYRSTNISIFVGEMVCQFNSDNRCVLPQGSGDQQISIQDQYSNSKITSYINYNKPTIVTSSSTKATDNQVIQFYGYGLGGNEDLEYLNIGPINIKSHCKSFNTWISCLLPSTIPLGYHPVAMKINGWEILMHYNLDFQKANIYLITYIQISPNTKRLTLSGENFPLGPNSYLLIRDDQGVHKIPIECESDLKCEWTFDSSHSLYNKVLQSVSIAAMDVTESNSVLITYVIYGIVFLDSNFNSILDGNEQPIDDVQVVLLGNNGVNRELLSFYGGNYYFEINYQNLGILTFYDRAMSPDMFSLTVSSTTYIPTMSRIEMTGIFFEQNLPLQPVVDNICKLIYTVPTINPLSGYNQLNLQHGTTNVENFGWCNTPNCRYQLPNNYTGTNCKFISSSPNVIVTFKHQLNIRPFMDPLIRGSLASYTGTTYNTTIVKPNLITAFLNFTTPIGTAFSKRYQVNTGLINIDVPPGVTSTISLISTDTIFSVLNQLVLTGFTGTIEKQIGFINQPPAGTQLSYIYFNTNNYTGTSFKLPPGNFTSGLYSLGTDGKKLVSYKLPPNHTLDLHRSGGSIISSQLINQGDDGRIHNETETLNSFGSWRTPFTAEMVATENAHLVDLIEPTDTLSFLVEYRPTENGRLVLVQIDQFGNKFDLVPSPFSVRTTVHEYPGSNSVVFLNKPIGNKDPNFKILFSNFVDQGLYLHYPHRSGSVPTLVTKPGSPLRFADGSLDEMRNLVYYVCEDHTNTSNVLNYLVSFSLKDYSIKIIASGFDFYAYPRLKQDGTKLAYIAWDFPNMPWDDTSLFIQEITEDLVFNQATRPINRRRRYTNNEKTLKPIKITGPSESALNPTWVNDDLYFVSDRTDGVWTVHRYRNHQIQVVIPPGRNHFKEIGGPLWELGENFYCFITNDILIAQSEKYIMTFNVRTNQYRQIENNVTTVTALACGDHGRVSFIGGSATALSGLVSLDYNIHNNHIDMKVIYQPSIIVDPKFISIGEEIKFMTTEGDIAYAYYYAPKNPLYPTTIDMIKKSEKKPPLLVKSHGGPTGQKLNKLDLAFQFWTSRGFSILDVNYRGSTGYGREYRQRLYKNWGIFDIDDLCYGAHHMVSLGLASNSSLLVDGSSAGGYSTLSVLTFRDSFAAGTSLFGIGDLYTLFEDTHKFESKYEVQLIAPLNNETKHGVYYERSPINFVDHLNAPVAFFHGADDNVVPPSQSITMYNALVKKGIPTLIEIYPNERHGFMIESNIIRALEGEYFFFSYVLKFPPVDIQNTNFNITIPHKF